MRGGAIIPQIVLNSPAPYAPPPPPQHNSRRSTTGGGSRPHEHTANGTTPHRTHTHLHSHYTHSTTNLSSQPTLTTKAAHGEWTVC